MEIPELGEGATDAKESVRNLVPWLPDPYKCPECGVYCTTSRKYDPRTAAFHPGGMAPSWKCPECGSEYRRVE